jgi:hypothetical protein
MGYSVRLLGEIAIEPPLSAQFVEYFNTLAGGRNNTFGDADPLCFDSVLHNMIGGETVDNELSANTKVPSAEFDGSHFSLGSKLSLFLVLVFPFYVQSSIHFHRIIYDVD